MSAVRGAGARAFAELDGAGQVVVFRGTTEPCQHCRHVGRTLKLRYYRRVIGLLVVDYTYTAGGYFCGPCQRRLFSKHMALTLLLGWWGLFALAFRNPYAIGVNLWALFSPPLGGDNVITTAELLEEALNDPARAHFYPNRDEIIAVLERTRRSGPRLEDTSP